MALVAITATTPGNAVAPLSRPEQRTTFPHSIREVPTAPADASGRSNRAFVTRAVLRPEEAAATMRFEVALAMRHFDELEARLASSEIISPTEMQARYLPLAAEHDRVVR